MRGLEVELGRDDPALVLRHLEHLDVVILAARHHVVVVLRVELVEEKM